MIPFDAPDPRDGRLGALRRLPGPVYGFVEQRSLVFEDLSVAEGGDAGGLTSVEIGLTYRLLRNPDDPDDPVNRADLDDEQRAALDAVPPWPRPDWLVAAAEGLRDAHLWETVRTSWHRDRHPPHTDLASQLTRHADHILVNHFRAELGIEIGAALDGQWRVRAAAVDTRATLVVDGVEVPAAEVDTDPFVYAIGARLRDDLVVTVVVPRDDLRHVRLALTTPPLAEGGPVPRRR